MTTYTTKTTIRTTTMGFVDPNDVNRQATTTTKSGLPTSTVRLTIRCHDLANKDKLSKSDPMCVIFQKTGPETWAELGRTEEIKNNLNPEWKERPVVKYSFEERQDLKFEIYDVDKKNSKNLKDHDLLGVATATLSSIVSSRGLKTNLVKGKGSITVMAEEVASPEGKVTFQFSATKLDNKDTFGKSDPFYIISKGATAGEYFKVFESEVVKNNLNPMWKPVTLNLQELCNGDYELPLKIDVYDHSSNGKHDFIGSFETTLRDLNTVKTHDVINPKKKEKKKYINSGVLKVDSMKLLVPETFLDYLRNGTKLHFSVAIDFTASNGTIESKNSLHYLNPDGDNDYTVAIKTVGAVIEDYDVDKQFPAFGFGAKIPPSGKVSHDFYLNLGTESPYGTGVDGVLDSYYQALKRVELFGPTNFAPSINHVARLAKSNADGRSYFVLLIITDGSITDINETKQAIVQASVLPVSIIIVGVGHADFSTMVELDSDQGLLKEPINGTIADRDIVQFVNMKRFISKGPNQEIRWDREGLSKAVLSEIPNQVIGWMHKRGVKPLQS